jgi:hypothetical protein
LVCTPPTSHQPLPSARYAGRPASAKARITRSPGPASAKAPLRITRSPHHQSEPTAQQLSKKKLYYVYK